jgi:DNA helicase II / ATP-dependent DNA helicase PcrA
MVDRVFPSLALTEEQEVAVAHDGGHLLIIAGAGTGKTTTLAARLAHLVQRGVAPERTMLLTFTRRAAAELTHRAEVLSGQRVSAACWGGTFHAMAARWLRRWGRHVGVDPTFTVLDAADSADLLALLRDELLPPGAERRRRGSKEAMASIWSRCVNARQPLGEVVRHRYPWCVDDLELLREVYRAYGERKAAMQVLDYDDLLLHWWASLRRPEAAAVASHHFDHVLVDEAQDLNALQGDILHALAGAGVTVTAVGDDAQAIYSFRAATVRTLLDFPQRFDADLVPLTLNHRSTPQVLAAANAVMHEATERHPKELRPTRPAGAAVRLVTAHDEHTQAVTVVDRILDRLDAGLALRRQAVLYRTTHHAAELQLELTLRNVPFVTYGGLRFLESAHVKDLLCLLRVTENPADQLAWFRLLQLVDGVGPAGARRTVAAIVSGVGLVSAATVAGLPDDVLAPVADLAAAVADARAEDLRHTPSAQVARVRRWLDPRVVRRPRSDARLADLDRLEQSAVAAADLPQFLTDLVLDPPASTGDLAGPPSLDEDVLTLSTIHSAKGGEWGVVHVIHLADGCLPSDLSTGRADDIEEERRLLHVAMTRARDELWLHVPLRYHHHRQGGRPGTDRHGTAQRCRFLTEEVVSLVQEEVAAPPSPLGHPTGDAGAGGSGASREAADYLTGLLG